MFKVLLKKLLYLALSNHALGNEINIENNNKTTHNLESITMWFQTGSLHQYLIILIHTNSTVSITCKNVKNFKHLEMHYFDIVI